jgi:transcriptional regulator with XRE-family HTH domain
MNIFLKLKETYITQLKASKAVGVADSTFSDWVNGNKIPRPERIRPIQDTYGFSDTEMMDSLYPRKKSAPTSLDNHGTR